MDSLLKWICTSLAIENSLDMEILAKFFVTIFSTDGNIQTFKDAMFIKYFDYISSLEQFDLLGMFNNTHETAQAYLENDKLNYDASGIEKFSILVNGIAKSLFRDSKEKSEENFRRITKILDIVQLLTVMAIENRTLLNNRTFSKVYSDIHNLLIEFLQDSFKSKDFKTTQWGIVVNKMSSVMVNERNSRNNTILLSWSLLVDEIILPLIKKAVEDLIDSTKSSVDDDFMIDEDTSPKHHEKEVCRKIIDRGLQFTGFMMTCNPNIQEKVVEELSIIFETSPEMFVKFDICEIFSKTGDAKIISKCLEIIPRSIGDNKSWRNVMEILAVMSEYLQDSHVVPFSDLLGSLLDVYKKGFFDRSSTISLAKAVVSASKMSDKFKELQVFRKTCKEFLTDDKFFPRLIVSQRLYEWACLSDIDMLVNEIFAILETATEKLKLRTCLLSLGLTTNPPLSKQVIFKLLSCYTNQEFQEKELAKLVMSKIANGDLTGFLVTNIRGIILDWVKDKTDFSCFPYELFGEKSLGPFLLNNAIDILPILFSQTQLKTFESICSCMNMDLKSILRKYFCYVFPYCLARCFIDRSLVKSVIEEKIRATLGAEVDSLIRKNITDILLQTLFLLAEKPDNILTFGNDLIIRTLSDLSKNAEKKEVEKLLCQDYHKSLNLIINIFELLSKKKNDSTRSFYIFKTFVLDIMGTNLQAPILLRSVFTVSLYCSDNPELFESNCSLLLEICSRILNSNNSVALTELQLTYPKIRNKMIDIISKGTTSAIPMKILMLLVCSQSMLVAVSKTEPFPDQEIFKEVNTIQQKIQGTENFFTQIGNILASDNLSPFTFTYISKLIKNHRPALMKVLSQQDKKASVLEDYFNKLISKLIGACSAENSDEWKELATITLGNLGLIQNIETAKLVDKSFIDEIDNDPNLTNKSPIWLSEVIKNSKSKILLTLNGYITETDVEVVKLAAKTLHRILTTTKNILEKIPDNKKHYFEPFLNADPNHQYIPHISSSSQAEVTLITDDLKEIFETNNKTHEQWLSQVIDVILNKTSDPFLGLCREMSKKKVKFAEMVFILSLLDFATGAQANKLNKEFSPLMESVLANQNTKAETIKLIATALDLLHRHYRFLVNQKQIKTKSVSGCFFIIPYYTIAKAAANAGITFSSLMFSELSFEKDNLLSFMDQLPIEFEEFANEGQKLLLSIYKSIDDPDCIYGATKSYGIQSKILLGEKEGNWTNTLGLYDTSVLENSASVIGVLDSMKNMGLDRVSSLILKSIQAEALDNPQAREHFFENRWKTFAIDNNLERYSPHSSNMYGFNEAIFNGLYALVKCDFTLFKETLSNHRKYIARMINIENAQSNLAKLQVLSELEMAWSLKWTEIGNVAFKENDVQDKNLAPLLGTNGIKNDAFTEIETLVNFRASLLRALKKNDLAVNHESEFISIARKEGQFTLATNLANRLSSQSGTPPSILEEAKILWDSGDTSGAIHILRFLIQQLEKKNQVDPALHTKSCYLLGKWLGESKTDSYENIIRLLQYSKEKFTNKSKACYQMGKFIDSLYQNIVRKQTSEDSKSYRELLEKNKELYRQYAEKRRELNEKEVTSEFKSKMNHLQKITELDQKEQLLIQTRQEDFRTLVLENFLQASSTSDNYDFVTIPRILNIWFSNSSNDKVNQSIYQSVIQLGQVPSHKFIPLFYQIASRMGYFPQECMFNNVVMHLLFKISKEHPYHTLPLILQIRNADQSTKTTSAKASYKPDPNKIKAANALIEKLKKENKGLIDSYSNLMDAYIQLAFLQLNDEQKRDQSTAKRLSSQLLITTIKRPGIPILTADFSVNPLGDYNPKELPCIENFSPNFTLAGGINLPKIISCISSNGQVYRQLVKGNDDMRQDHVIEQLFAIANSLLKKDKETRRRKLLIRTYKVIPTSPTSGILGFVENTQPMAILLIGNNEADYPQSLHGKYRPQDKTNSEVRRAMFQVEKKSDATTRIKTFVEICNNFKPAFHHFFLSQFPNPSDWFEKRQAYTKSVASISMLGYAIGLGDRHLNNILIDQSTGEAVHIDLGICFEQGKYLPIPELVPFRLTRDVIDGFGVSGIEGTFKNCCYATMTVLRNNIEALSLVVEVFLHDPLYKWALSPLEGYAVQKKKTSYTIESSPSSKNNRDAERALLRLKEKLLGQEDGELLGVKGQVNKLISEATAMDKLAVMFSGWSPFL